MRGIKFGLQLDKAPDSNEDAYVYNSIIVEDVLFCNSIIRSAMAQDLFEMLDQFITKNDLTWERCIGVCTNGARWMSGCYGELEAVIRSKSPHAMWTRCIIHIEALASKLIDQLNFLWKHIVDVANYIKTRPLKTLKKLCMDMEAEQTILQLAITFIWQCLIQCIRSTSRNSHFSTKGRSQKLQELCRT